MVIRVESKIVNYLGESSFCTVTASKTKLVQVKYFFFVNNAHVIADKQFFLESSQE